MRHFIASGKLARPEWAHGRPESNRGHSKKCIKGTPNGFSLFSRSPGGDKRVRRQGLCSLEAIEEVNQVLLLPDC